MGRDLFGRGISVLQPPVVPNYVLLHAQKYRLLWASYLELLRRIDEEDECWRWQHRLWADFTTLLIHMSLRQHRNIETIAESPLRISAEQQRGKWALVDALSGVFEVRTESGRSAVISFVRDAARSNTKYDGFLTGLGATSLIHVQDLDTRAEGVILIWPVHFFAEETPGLKQVVESAQRALANCLNSIGLQEDVDLSAKGLVLMSRLATGRTAQIEVNRREGDVIGHACRPVADLLKQSVSRVGEIISTFVDELIS